MRKTRTHSNAGGQSGWWSQEPQRASDQPDPYDHSRLYGDEQYRLNNMLLASANAPARLPAGCKTFDVWSDRSHAAWQSCREGIKSAELGDAWWHGVRSFGLLLFARRMAKAHGIAEGLVAGMRIVRYTNTGLHPILRLDIIHKNAAADS